MIYLRRIAKDFIFILKLVVYITLFSLIYYHLVILAHTFLVKDWQNALMFPMLVVCLIGILFGVVTSYKDSVIRRAKEDGSIITSHKSDTNSLLRPHKGDE